MRWLCWNGGARRVFQMNKSTRLALLGQIGGTIDESSTTRRLFLGA
jgi:hypothetical protein